jgi:hypothetical protein
MIMRLDLEDLLLAPRVNHSEAAAEKLFLLTTRCQNNVVAFLHEINQQELNMIVDMFSSFGRWREREAKEANPLRRTQSRPGNIAHIKKDILCWG